MTETASVVDIPEHRMPDRGGATARSGLGQYSHLVAISLELIAFVTLLTLFLARQSRESISTLQISLSIAALLAVAWNALRRERVWHGPFRRLVALIPQIRSGDAPIESLTGVGGQLAPLAAEFAALCHDLRRQRAELTKMQATLRQHVASRTNALERTIGSLKLKASRDALTGLYNRRAMDEHLPKAVERCREAGSDLCLLMIDVDHFKQLNDTCGHPAGDELLRNIGQIIRSTCRDGDVAFRYGGDEFAVVLENHGDPEGRALANRLRSLVDALARTMKVDPSPRLSIGMATLKNSPAAEASALLKAADQNLYEIKKSRGSSSRSGEGKAKK